MSPTSIRLAIPLFHGFDELDVVGPFEVLRAAEVGGAPLHTELVSFDDDRVFVGGHGLTVTTDAALDDSWDWVVVPGGAWAARGPRGAWAEIQRGLLPARLAELWRAGKNMASVCTGSMILAAAGITRGRRAVSHHVALEALAASGAVVVSERVVDDGNLITAGGVTSGIDLALHLVARIAGPEAAAKGASRLEYQPQAAFRPGV
ncbi:MAG: DJ-1/PfpI family protein [Myxococcales bacterium]|nr:DJ-1/PfpI family protein [Myxococcales bacterium]